MRNNPISDYVAQHSHKSFALSLAQPTIDGKIWFADGNVALQRVKHAEGI
jgi:hypothetical protein